MRALAYLIGALLDDTLYIGLTLIAYSGIEHLIRWFGHTPISAGWAGLGCIVLWLIVVILGTGTERTDT